MSCNTCQYKSPGEIPGEGKWVCNNGESSFYGDDVRLNDCCEEYRKDHRRDWRQNFRERFEKTA